MIEFEKFERYLLELKELERLESKINDSLRELSPDFGGFSMLRATELILELLKDVTNDNADWISYYIYELDWGKEWKEGTITDTITGKDIKLESIKDLYDLIVEEGK